MFLFKYRLHPQKINMNFIFSLLNKISLSLIILFLMATFSSAKEESGNTIVTAEEIIKMNVRNIYDLMNQISGVVADSSTVSIRGSKKVKVILDGRTINDPVSGDVKWSQISINNVEKIEILKGGGSVEYGENSSGGVILITSKKSTDWSGSLEAYGGNLCTQSYSSDLQMNIDAFSAGVSLGYYRTDGFRANDDKDKKRAGIKLSYELQKDIKFSPSFDYYKEKKGLAGIVGQPTPNYRKDYESYSGTLISNIKFIKSKTYYNDVVEKNNNPDVPIEVRIHPRTIEQELSSQFSLDKWGKLSAGAGFQYADVDVKKDLSTGKETEMHVDRKSWLYTTLETGYKPYFISFYAGLRGLYYSRFRNSVNPEVRLGYGREKYGVIFGFNMTDNSPTFKQRYNQTTVTMPNPDLEKERAVSNSITLYLLPIKSISVNVAPFYNVVKKIIIMNTFSAGSQKFLKYENVDRAILKGVDTSIDWKPIKALSFNLCYIYLRAIDKNTGKYLPGKSRHETKLKSIIQLFDMFSVAITSSYISRQYSNISNTRSVDGYYLATCRSDFKFNSIKAFGEVKNVFDQEFKYYYGYPGSPRTWIAGLQYEF